MFWECSLHNKCRKKAKLKTDMLLNRAMQQHGHAAKNHLTNIIDNNAFQHTSTCPDDIIALKQYKQNITKGALFSTCASAQHIITYDTAGAEHFEINGTWYVVVYTDGSTIMPESHVFSRSGCGIFLSEGNTKNFHDKLEGASQSTYRSKLRAIIHVLKHAATDILVRSDCKSVVDGFNKIINGIPMIKTNDDYDLWNYA